MISFRRAMVLSVMWSTSVAAVEWTELSSSSDAPSPRARHTMVVLDDGSAVMFGGKKQRKMVRRHLHTHGQWHERNVSAAVECR